MSIKEAGKRMNELLMAAGQNVISNPVKVATELARAVELPLRQGVLKGDIVGDLYESEKLQPGVQAEYPLDLLTPGTEDEYSAYTIPAQGRIPEMHVQGDYVTVPTFEIGASIDLAKKYARDARWNVVQRAIQVLEGMVVRKHNSDGWRCIISAAYNRFINVYDDKVVPGFFSKRVVELGKNVMRRFAGGNSTSVNRGRLDRIYLSPEGLGDIRTWDVTQADPITRREIFVDDELDRMKIFGVELRSIDELGYGQEFQSYWESKLGASMPTYTLNGTSYTKLEIMVGVDLSHGTTFYHPVREEFGIQEDQMFARQRRISFWAYAESGWSVLDGRRVLALSI